MTKSLSPTAQAVIDAVVAASPKLRDTPPERRPIGGYRSTCLAAAIRSLVDGIDLSDAPPWYLNNGSSESAYQERAVMWMKRKMESVADEMEGNE